MCIVALFTVEKISTFSGSRARDRKISRPALSPLSYLGSSLIHKYPYIPSLVFRMRLKTKVPFYVLPHCRWVVKLEFTHTLTPYIRSLQYEMHTDRAGQLQCTRGYQKVLSLTWKEPEIWIYSALFFNVVPFQLHTLVPSSYPVINTRSVEVNILVP